ncbi:M57 family metalloprotease [Flavobacterium sp. Root186]|uniref:M57 family metalloprotease n=1 Tax=Flavobacterium sp. Root186 TaxID=1736485 RepID=UPI0006FA83AF|nr:M57 family metalloprotease [Flavobacterium sp. Root186]KRB53891.1 hypothetical protein ASD98_19870 [Flavobacterium sp. Root186]
MKIKKAIVTLLVISTLFSCENNDSNVSTENSNSSLKITNDNSLVINEILKKGFKKEDIVESKDYFIVQGDMLFSKNIHDYAKSNLTARHNYTSSLVSAQNRIIKVKIHSSIPTSGNWRDAIRYAIASWKDISNTSILFVETHEETADILIGSDEGILGTTTGGYALMPSAEGRPGAMVSLNLDIPVNYGTKIRIVAHELGHTVGILHTDEAGTNYVPNSPASDPNSIMNSTSNGGWAGFSQYDIQAVQFLYPTLACNTLLNGPDAGTCAFDRYNDRINYNVYVIGRKQTNVESGTATWTLTSSSLEMVSPLNESCEIRVKANNTTWPATGIVTRTTSVGCSTTFTVSLNNCINENYSD